MQATKCTLIIDLRAGEDLTKLIDMVTVLEAAGWQVDLALKEYGGASMQLAKQAARDRYDVVIAYGGDGTLNQVVNGVKKSGEKSVVAIIPGGTANQWAGEIGVPLDPIEAGLCLLMSEARQVDIGRVSVQQISFPDTSSPTQAASQSRAADHEQAQRAKKGKDVAKASARQYFLLTAGLGLDASFMEHVSKTLKDHVGRVAFDVAAMQQLPKRHAFPIEVFAAYEGEQAALLWQGEALQVIIGNTRRYAGVVEFTPDALLDDGQLDVCLISAGNVLNILEQATSLLVKRRPASGTTEHMRAAHLLMRVPASVPLQVDGSAVKLDDYLSASDSDALHKADAQQAMVTYCFDALPQALHVAIPRAYDNALFQHPSAQAKSPDLHASYEDVAASQNPSPATTAEMPEWATQQLEGKHYKVTIIGVAPHQQKKLAFVMAGTTPDPETGDKMHIVIRITQKTTLLRATGGSASPSELLHLHAGAELIVVGKKNKRNIVRAKLLML